MNSQQARIGVLLTSATEQFQETGRVDTAVLAALAEEGYPLASLEDDLTRTLSNR